MVKCLKCGNHLKAIGKNRKNGKYYEGNNGMDWNTRKFCKKCYKDVKEEQSFILFYNNDNHELQMKLLKLFKEKYNLEKLI